MDYIFNTKTITRHFVEKIILIYNYNTVAFSSRTVGFWTLFKKIQLHPNLVEYRVSQSDTGKKAGLSRASIEITIVEKGMSPKIVKKLVSARIPSGGRSCGPGR